MELIERAAAVALIEAKQKEFCPSGMFSRNAVYGTDRERFDAWDEIIDQIDAIPTIDGAPVVHGRWIFDAGVDYCWKCSECKCPAPFYMGFTETQEKTPHCPNCGARMGGGEGHEN